MSNNFNIARFPFFDLGQDILKSLAAFKEENWKAKGGADGKFVPSFITSVVNAVVEAAHHQHSEDTAKELGTALQAFNRLRGHVRTPVCTNANATPRGREYTECQSENQEYTEYRNSMVSVTTRNLLGAVLRLRQIYPEMLDAHPFIQHLANNVILSVSHMAYLMAHEARVDLNKKSPFSSVFLQLEESIGMYAEIHSASISPAENDVMDTPRVFFLNLRLRMGEENVLHSQEIGSAVVNASSIANLPETVIFLFNKAKYFLPSLSHRSVKTPSIIPLEIRELYQQTNTEPLLKQMDAIKANRQRLEKELAALNAQYNSLQLKVASIRALSRCPSRSA